MGLVARVSDLEKEVDHLRAVVDGGEAQAREAIVVAFGLVADFAARSGALDLDRLIEFLSVEAGPKPALDDKTGMLIHGIHLILTFHRDLAAGTLEPPGGATDVLTKDECRTILRRAEAMVSFDRETDRAIGTDPISRPGGTRTSGH